MGNIKVRVSVSGINNAINALKKTNLSKVSGTKAAAAGMEGARMFRDMIQSNAPYKSGRLAGSVSIYDVETTYAGAGFRCKIGPLGVIYAAIQEFGGVITPKTAARLVFVWEGKKIFAKAVYIRPKYYVTRAFEEGEGAVRARILAMIGGA